MFASPSPKREQSALIAMVISAPSRREKTKNCVAHPCITAAAAAARHLTLLDVPDLRTYLS